MNTRLLSTLLFCGLLLLTNRWLSYEEGISVLIADDTKSYMAIAKAAPALPDGSVKLASNHTMRFVPAWKVGTMAHILGVSEQSVFLVATLIICGLIVWLTHKILSLLNITDAQYSLCMALFILSPYTFRYYLAVPAMIGDMVFVLGLGGVMLGLLRVQLPMVLLGGFVAVIGRQNAIIFLPAVIIWMLVGNGWKNAVLTARLVKAAALVAVIVVPYILLGIITAPFSEHGLENEALTGVFTWAMSANPISAKFRQFVEYMLRINICLLLPLFILAGALWARLSGSSERLRDFLRRLPREVWLALLVMTALYGFAFLGGPDLFMSGVTRYVSHSMIGLFVAFAVVLRELKVFEKINGVSSLLLGALIMTGSFHHITTFGGSTSDKAAYFAAISVVVALTAGVVTYFSVKHE